MNEDTPLEDDLPQDIPEDLPEDQPEPEAPEEKPEPQEEREEDKYVPYGALYEERKKRQALQAEVEDYRNWKTVAQERLDKLTEASQVPDIVPDFDEDPVAHMKHTLDKLNSRSEEQAKAQQEWTQQQQAQQQHQQLLHAYQAQAREFSQKQPDFGDGYQHFVKSWTTELTAMGYSPDQANEIITAEEAKIVDRARRNGENAAEVVYNIAKMRGYQPKAKNNLGAIKEGQNAAKSMGGGKAEGRLTLEALAEMDPEEFAKLSDKDFRRVMGG